MRQYQKGLPSPGLGELAEIRLLLFLGAGIKGRVTMPGINVPFSVSDLLDI